MASLPKLSFAGWLLPGLLLTGVCLVLGWQLWQVRRSLARQAEQLATLRRELSHRVNTNLAIAIGLLEIQLAQTLDALAREPLQQSLDRMRSVALLQERLYQGHVPTGVNLRQYVYSLYQSLTHQAVITNLNLDLDTDELNADLALPLGLILHELLSDSTRHAAPQQPNIRIRLKKQNGWLLELLDQGPTFDAHSSRWTRAGVTLPKRMIEALADQIGGACAMIPGKGMHFQLHINQS